MCLSNIILSQMKLLLKCDTVFANSEGFGETCAGVVSMLFTWAGSSLSLLGIL